MTMAKIIKLLQHYELDEAMGWVKLGSLSSEIIYGQKYYFVSFDDYVIGPSLFSLVMFL